MVRIIVPLIIGFLLSIVYCLKRIYIKYSKKQELCKNNNYNNIKGQTINCLEKTKI